MFENWFKKEERDIDQLIFDIAEYQRKKDYKVFYRLIKETKLYCYVDPESIKNIPQGEKYTTKSTDNVKTTYAQINGMKLIVFFTFKNDERLKNSYFEIDGIDALEMALKSEETSGLLIQNKNISWVGFDKEQIRWILSKYKY